MATKQTKKKNNTGILVVVFLLVIVLLVFLANRSRTATEIPSVGQDNKSTGGSTGSVGSSIPSGSSGATLKYGSKGTEVKKLQFLMNAYLKAMNQGQIAVDGVFGPMTQKALFTATGRNSITYSEAYKIAKARAAQYGFDINDYM